MKNHNYLVYMTTNPRKSTLYTGMTNNLVRRLVEHYQKRGNDETFAGKYFCYNLVWFEWHKYVYNAIGREKEIKGFTRKQKEDLIAEMNPEWRFFNAEICGMWPPNQELLEALGKEENKDVPPMSDAPIDG
ncbi:MAG: GIY-YIG nuclease family protein [Saprospiraceae bacterium]